MTAERTGATERAGPEKPAERRVAYAYAVARSADGLAEAVSPLAGVAGAPVSLVGDDSAPGLVLAVSAVPAGDFDEEALKRQLEDLDRLTAIARAHHAVVDALAARTTVLPLRLATVYLDAAGARRVLREHGPELAAALDRLTGHAEWGVKVYAVAPGPDAAPDPAAETPGAPGRSYLRQRRAQEGARTAVRRDAATAASRVQAEAARYAAARARHRPQSGSLAGTTDENVVNDAYLVPEAYGGAFREAVGRAAGGLGGVRVEVTGPWAPYSFTGGVPVGDDESRGDGSGGGAGAGRP
ncbi:GvpL/GvpF family gas vesicle protein [Streptomyces sp. NPDC005805]|uniref:GvpL/GvpF family gas vesicle protein n=1 Tax=Streptomyces sp. NPDC005805 TaxID=3157068 RepID=UPI0033CB664C